VRATGRSTSGRGALGSTWEKAGKPISDWEDSLQEKDRGGAEKLKNAGKKECRGRIPGKARIECCEKTLRRDGAGGERGGATPGYACEENLEKAFEGREDGQR